MLSDPPQMSMWLTVPNSCWMRCDFEVGDYGAPDVHITFGGDDGTHLLFERTALERFVALAQRMLAVPTSPDSRTTTSTILESSYQCDIREIPSLY